MLVLSNFFDNCIVSTAGDVPNSNTERKNGVVSKWQTQACYRLFEVLILRAMTSV